MVGNADEWVEDWVDSPTGGCTDWASQTTLEVDDLSCFGGDGSSAGAQIPGALLRGGHSAYGGHGGVFSVYSLPPSHSDEPVLGFRCAR
jgi:hypothetical protein